MVLEMLAVGVVEIEESTAATVVAVMILIITITTMVLELSFSSFQFLLINSFLHPKFNNIAIRYIYI